MSDQHEGDWGIPAQMEGHGDRSAGSKRLPAVAYSRRTQCAGGGIGVVYGADVQKQDADFLLSVWQHKHSGRLQICKAGISHLFGCGRN